MKILKNLNSENLKNLNSENLEDSENLTISERVLRFAMQSNRGEPKFENSKVGLIAKHPQNKKNKNISTHPSHEHAATLYLASLE